MPPRFVVIQPSTSVTPGFFVSGNEQMIIINDHNIKKQAVQVQH